MGTKSQRRWTWSAGGETVQGEAVEVEGRSLSEITADFDSECVAVVAAGRLVGPGNNSALEAGFGGAVEVEDMEKTEMGAGVEVESVIVRDFVWCPWYLSGHLERQCFERGRDLKLHCLGMTGAAGWKTEGSPLQMERGKKEKFISHYIREDVSHISKSVHLISPFSCPSSSSLSVLLSFSASLSSKSLPGPGLCGGRDSARTR